MSKSAPQTPPPTAALLASSLQALGEGVFVAERKLHRDGLRICYVNDMLLEMTGYQFEEMVGSGHGSIHVEKTDRERLARWLRAPNPSRPLLGEGFLRRQDDSKFYAAWVFSPVKDQAGKVTHIVATYRDTTEKRNLQDMLDHTQRLEAVGRLAGGVAHDFNNLISVINGYCEMLISDLAEQPQALREVTEIYNAGRKAAKLTRQLLAFGRQEPLNAQVLNLNTMVKENAGILTRLLHSTGVLELDLDPELRNVRTDAAQFQQVLLNLTLNARDALRDKGRVTITTQNRCIKAKQSRRTDDLPPGNYVLISVKDNGTGMDENTQKHLFEPFFTTKTEGKGSGLGLAMVYGVVQQSGGRIRLHSEILAGSTFEIMLPAVDEEIAPSPVKPPAPISTQPTPKGNESVLVVEEDDVLRKMLTGMLTADGYRAMDACTTSEGLTLAKAAPRPVQLLVINLGGAGEKMARALHKTNPDLRILNACNQGARHAPKWIKAQHLATMTKPFALSELLKAIRGLLDT
jgi:PAS domain S-box-containing protein